MVVCMMQAAFNFRCVVVVFFLSPNSLYSTTLATIWSAMAWPWDSTCALELSLSASIVLIASAI